MYTIRLIWNKMPHWIAWLLIFLDVCIWEVPQNLVGAIVKLVYCRYGSKEVESERFGKCQVQNWGMTSGVSLGMWQFTHTYVTGATWTNLHEIAHSKQSLYLGPLYLFTVGICSFIHAATWNPSKGSYYNYWCERWADRLAGIPDR